MKKTFCDLCGQEIKIGDHVFKLDIEGQTTGSPEWYEVEYESEVCTDCIHALREVITKRRVKMKLRQ